MKRNDCTHLYFKTQMVAVWNFKKYSIRTEGIFKTTISYKSKMLEKFDIYLLDIIEGLPPLPMCLWEMKSSFKTCWSHIPH